MGYQTLYRKYRPQTFEQVVGQKHVSTILRNSIRQDRTSHAYLFSGQRGTGKTSVARIFAKALNCPQVKDGEPCGTCEVCTSIAEGNAPDIIEIDAASNRGIDDIRELRERVHYAPARFKYKIYIIDEAHMITTQGFNALLKTLEEPPPHAVFILCTTEPHKLPITILSRVLRFEFRRLPLDALAAHAQEIARNEGAELTEQGALELAKLAEGSVRDIISLLEQAMAYEPKTIDERRIDELFHLASPQQVVDLALALLRSDKEEMVRLADELILSGRDPERLLLDLASELEKYLLSRSQLRQTCEAHGVPYVEIADERLVAAVSECWEASSHLRREANPTLLLRITLYRIAHVLAQEKESARTPTPKPEASDRPESVAVEHPILGSRQRRRGNQAASSPSATAGEPPPLGDPLAGEVQVASTEEHAVSSQDSELKPDAADLFRKPEGKPSPSATAGTPDEPLPAEPPPEAAVTDKVPKLAEAVDTAVGKNESPDSRWEELLDSVRSESLTTFCLLFEGPNPKVGEGQLALHYPYRLRFFAQLLRQPSNLRVLEHLVKKHYGEDWKVEIASEGEGERTAAAEQATRDVLDLFTGSRETELGK